MIALDTPLDLPAEHIRLGEHYARGTHRFLDGNRHA
jgi:hypothetical protein